MRAVSVRVNEVVGVAGYVLPGTRVDVVATASPTDGHADTTSKVVLRTCRCSPPARAWSRTRISEARAGDRRDAAGLPGAGRAARARQHRRQDSARAAQPARPGCAGDARHQDRRADGHAAAPVRQSAARVAAARGTACHADRSGAGGAMPTVEIIRGDKRAHGSDSVVTSSQFPVSASHSRGRHGGDARLATGNWQLVTGNCFRRTSQCGQQSSRRHSPPSSS